MQRDSCDRRERYRPARVPPGPDHLARRETWLRKARCWCCSCSPGSCFSAPSRRSVFGRGAAVPRSGKNTSFGTSDYNASGVRPDRLHSLWCCARFRFTRTWPSSPCSAVVLGVVGGRPPSTVLMRGGGDSPSSPPFRSPRSCSARTGAQRRTDDGTPDRTVRGAARGAGSSCCSWRHPGARRPGAAIRDALAGLALGASAPVRQVGEALIPPPLVYVVAPAPGLADQAAPQRGPDPVLRVAGPGPGYSAVILKYGFELSNMGDAHQPAGPPRTPPTAPPSSSRPTSGPPVPHRVGGEVGRRWPGQLPARAAKSQQSSFGHPDQHDADAAQPSRTT